MEGIYLNNAATSWPKPGCVAEAVSAALTERPGSAHRGGIEDFDVFDEVRRALARRMGVTAHENIALGPNATWGLNAAILGYPLSAGDTVLTTMAEHNSVLRPLHRLEKEKGIRLIYLPADSVGRVSVEAWEQAVKEYRPRLCVFTHASNVTGAVNDAAGLAAAAASAGCTVLMDASQTLGAVPVCCEDWGIDMLAFTGHKYLLGPQGTGGLYVREGLKLAPLLVGGTGIKSDMDDMPEEMPLHLEAGTGNEPSYHGLLAALRWAGENPADSRAVSERMGKLKEGLRAAGAAVVEPGGECTAVLSFNIPGKSPEEVGYLLRECYDITCRSGLHCAPRIFSCLGVTATVRLSLSRFTTDEEIAETVAAVRDIAGG